MPRNSANNAAQEQEPSKAAKLINWFLFSIFIALVPLALVAWYLHLHNQTATFEATIKNGELVAIAIAILGEAVGDITLNESINPLGKRGVIFLSIVLLLFASITLISFIAVANCSELNPTDASKACQSVMITPGDTVLDSCVMYVLALIMGFACKFLEK